VQGRYTRYVSARLIEAVNEFRGDPRQATIGIVEVAAWAVSAAPLPKDHRYVPASQIGRHTWQALVLSISPLLFND
jgi:hypothetical protein